MAPTPSQLAAWLKADANKIGYAAAMSVKAGGTAAITQDGTLAALGNAPQASLSCLQPIPIADVLIWAAAGPMQVISDYATNTANPAAMRSICMAAMKMFEGAAQALDMTNQSVYGSSQSLVESLQTAELLTSQQVASIVVLGTKQPCSDFEKAFGVGTVVSWQQINAALGE